MSSPRRLLRPIPLRLVEDNAGDVELTREALLASDLMLELSVVGDGVQASDFLHRRAGYARAMVPDLVLLDLNLPRRSGLEVLHEIKGDPELRIIPIVVLTSSEEERDIVSSYREGANCFVTKPSTLGAMHEVVEHVRHFWTTVARLPFVPTNG